MTSALPRFPPYPIRGVRVLHRKQNCAPHFAQIEVDFEPAAEGFAFEVAQGLTVEYEPAEDLPRFFAAVAAGIEELLSAPEHEAVIATRVVLRHARADTFGSHESAFRIAGYLAARQAMERTGSAPPNGAS
ncbi:hypothetical protein [Streptomyces sp. CRN 30]|uniref:hypothetical protein n=1 Tax=Streptomyces sp. CRN 30 TaxID=3075613 RepID=UPI002A84009E|nr:hypothetical protein [Streptomyces sp. CRN 30]